MKKVFTLLLVLVALGASRTQVAGNISQGIAEEIEIKDRTTNRGGVLRSAPAPAVSAWLSDAQIDLTFLQDLGSVTITVANAQETVYSATLTAEDGTQTTVSTAGWSPDSYTITITRSNGQTLTGDFEL